MLDYFLSTLQADFSYCGDLIYEEAALGVIDVTSHSDLLDLDPNFSQSLSSTAFTIHSVSSTYSDFSTDFTATDGKQLCSLVGEALSSANAASSAN